MNQHLRESRKSESPHERVRDYAFTLVELLVALTIASILTAIALPTLKDSMRQTTLSRSASLLKGAFINARGQAIRTGRPFGVVIERQRHEIGSGNADQLNFTVANYATRLYYVQSPMEYRGDYQDAFVYPIYEDSDTTNSTDVVVPRFFIPRSSAGLLYAAAATNNAGNATAAKRMINAGTRFSVGNTDYVFQITGLEQITLTTPPVTTPPTPPPPSTNLGGNRRIYHPGVPANPGTLVSFNVLEFSPRHAQLPGRLFNTQAFAASPDPFADASAASTFPAALKAFQSNSFQFLSNPIKAPLAPVSLIGKTVVDLSISGTSNNPVAFNCQDIIDPAPGTTIPPLNADVNLHDVTVMFSPDGQLSGVYYDERILSGTAPPAITGFRDRRIDPSASVSFNIGYIDGIVSNVDDIARYPQHIAGTDFQPNPNDPTLAAPLPAAALQVVKTPNFANSDCAWITIRPLSGDIALTSVASQPDSTRLINYYGYSNPFARTVVRDRLRQSRRLASAGTLQ